MDAWSWITNDESIRKIKLLILLYLVYVLHPDLVDEALHRFSDWFDAALTMKNALVELFHLFGGCLDGKALYKLILFENLIHLFLRIKLFFLFSYINRLLFIFNNRFRHLAWFMPDMSRDIFLWDGKLKLTDQVFAHIIASLCLDKLRI